MHKNVPQNRKRLADTETDLVFSKGAGRWGGRTGSSGLANTNSSA